MIGADRQVAAIGRGCCHVEIPLGREDGAAGRPPCETRDTPAGLHRFQIEAHILHQTATGNDRRHIKRNHAFHFRNRDRLQESDKFLSRIGERHRVLRTSAIQPVQVNLVGPGPDLEAPVANDLHPAFAIETEKAVFGTIPVFECWDFQRLDTSLEAACRTPGLIGIFFGHDGRQREITFQKRLLVQVSKCAIDGKLDRDQSRDQAAFDPQGSVGLLLAGGEPHRIGRVAVRHAAVNLVGAGKSARADLKIAIVELVGFPRPGIDESDGPVDHGNGLERYVVLGDAGNRAVALHAGQPVQPPVLIEGKGKMRPFQVHVQNPDLSLQQGRQLHPHLKSRYDQERVFCGPDTNIRKGHGRRRQQADVRIAENRHLVTERTLRIVFESRPVDSPVDKERPDQCRDQHQDNRDADCDVDRIQTHSPWSPGRGHCFKGLDPRWTHGCIATIRHAIMTQAFARKITAGLACRSVFPDFKARE